MFKHITFTLAALALLASCSVKDDRLGCLSTQHRLARRGGPDLLGDPGASPG